MLLWAAIVYTLALGILSIAAAALTPRAEREIRRVAQGPERGRLGSATPLQVGLRFCLYSLPTWVFGAVVSVWISHAKSHGAGYALGAIPFAIALAPLLLWQCVAHDASPATRLEPPAPQPVILATRYVFVGPFESHP